jgi:signal transduction histidine kinase
MINPLQNTSSCGGANEMREVAMDLVVASIAHEIKQPLAAIVANADAIKRGLSHAPPNIEEANASLDHIANEDIELVK